MNFILKIIFWLTSFFSPEVESESPKRVMKVKPPDPAPTHDWNPLFRFPRNDPCWCESGLKAKKCCIPKLNQRVDAEFARNTKPLINNIRKQA